MKEKKKTVPEKTTTGGGDSPFDAMKGGLAANPNVFVSSGPYAEDLPVAGCSVGEVRKRFKDRFDIGDKAAAIVNGKTVDDSEILKSGESLMFIMHAGEKGATTVTLDGKQATCHLAADHRLSIKTLVDRLAPSMSTGDVVLPTGVRAVFSRGPVTIWVWERCPNITQLSWIAEDSPRPYGPGTMYRKVSISLPYLIILATFIHRDGEIRNLCRDECFFRPDRIKSLDDPLFYPGLLNCSKYNVEGGNPLSWICTQYLEPSKCEGTDSEQFNSAFEMVRKCLLETSFNLSSEHHEGNSWYGASKKIDPRIATPAAWEKATKEDPLFSLEVPWIRTGYSVKQVVERMLGMYAPNASTVTTSDDIAKIIING